MRRVACCSVVVGDGVAGALKNFHRINGTLPERIVVYRDGVSDGQLESVHKHEVTQLLDCFKAIGQDYQYEMTPLFSALTVL